MYLSSTMNASTAEGTMQTIWYGSIFVQQFYHSEGNRILLNRIKFVRLEASASLIMCVVTSGNEE